MRVPAGNRGRGLQPRVPGDGSNEPRPASAPATESGGTPAISAGVRDEQGQHVQSIPGAGVRGCAHAKQSIAAPGRYARRPAVPRLGLPSAPPVTDHARGPHRLRRAGSLVVSVGCHSDRLPLGRARRIRGFVGRPLRQPGKGYGARAGATGHHQSRAQGRGRALERRRRPESAADAQPRRGARGSVAQRCDRLPARRRPKRAEREPSRRRDRPANQPAAPAHAAGCRTGATSGVATRWRAHNVGAR
jgi:hypothetical protein